MFRVFSGTATEIPPAALLGFLQSLEPDAVGRSRGDDDGWFQADFHLPGEDASLRLERFLAMEDGIRAELNTWAAWLETKEDNPHVGRLMPQMIAAQQVFVLRDDSEECAELCAALCRFLADRTDGVYQVDGQGFFDAVGLLLVAEDV